MGQATRGQEKAQSFPNRAMPAHASRKKRTDGEVLESMDYLEKFMISNAGRIHGAAAAFSAAH